MIKNSFKQKSDIFIVTMIVLVIAIIAGLGFILWNNISDRTATPDNMKDSHTLAKSPAVSPDYFTVSSWNVKFKIVDQLKSTEIKYYERKSADTPSQTYFSFTTTRTQALGGSCATQPFGDTEILNRYTDKPIATPDGELLNNVAIGGYYYVLSSSVNACSTIDHGSPSDVEIKDQASLKTSIETIASAE